MSKLRTEIVDKLAKTLQPYSKVGTQCDVQTVKNIHVLVDSIFVQYERDGLIDEYEVNVDTQSRHAITATVKYMIVNPQEEITVECVINITQPSFSDAFDRAMKGI